MTDIPSGDHGERLDIRILHAFADGELEPEEAARVVLHLADCPTDQEAVDRIMAMNAMMAQACSGPMQEPIPPRIRSAIFGEPAAVGTTTPLSRRRIYRFAGLTGGALAAGLAALAIWLPGVSDPDLPLGRIAARSPIAEALDELASGGTQLVAHDTELGVIASFAVKDGYCREISLDRSNTPDLIALACHDAEGWQITARLEMIGMTPASGYTPAEGQDDDPIGAYLDRVQASSVLSPDLEARAKEAGWH